eukprot:scaffold97051_cov39-Attheya_sp.AAC.1
MLGNAVAISLAYLDANSSPSRLLSGPDKKQENANIGLIPKSKPPFDPFALTVPAQPMPKPSPNPSRTEPTFESLVPSFTEKPPRPRAVSIDQTKSRDAAFMESGHRHFNQITVLLSTTPSNISKKAKMNFLRTIKSILATPIPEFEPTEFQFAMNRHAAEANWQVDRGT